MSKEHGGIFPLPDHNETERELDKLEAAWADFAHGVRTGMRFRRSDPTRESIRARNLVAVRIALDAYKSQFEGGDPIALLHALVCALEESVPVPYWIADQFIHRMQRVSRMEGSKPLTLHDAFELQSVVPTTDKRWRAAKKDMILKAKLWRTVATLMHKEGLKLTPALRRATTGIGGIPIGMTRARELFNEQDRIQRLHLGKRPRKGITSPR
jgi:hypothetical protein